MQPDVLVLIAARPGLIRDGLQAVLAAMPQIEMMDPVDDGPSALKKMAEHQPALVLLDTNLPDDQVWTLLQQIKARWPQIQCLILADSGRQQQTAQAAGADGVLIKGFPTKELYASVKRLLSRHGDPGSLGGNHRGE